MIDKVKALIGDAGLKAKTAKGREMLLSEKINVTEFLVWFMEKYPESADIMLKDPDYQLKFRN